MNKIIIQQMVSLLLGMVSDDLIKKGIDKLLDIIEEAVEKSETDYDNIIVLPLCKLIRNTFDVPDND